MWNFLTMYLAGLANSFSDGIPGRQLFLSDKTGIGAGVFINGMFMAQASRIISPLPTRQPA
jgi:hypothetical protein